MMAGPVPRFVLRTFGWLPLTFAVWYFAAPLLLWPAQLLVDLLTRLRLADIVRAVEQTGTTYTFATTLKPGRALAASGTVTVDVNTLLYSFGLPFYAALVLAAREAGWPRKLVIGYAVIIPFVAWGVLADFL